VSARHSDLELIAVDLTEDLPASPAAPLRIVVLHEFLRISCVRRWLMERLSK